MTHRRHSMPFGAEVLADGRVRCRLWAPAAQRVDLLVVDRNPEAVLPMAQEAEGWFGLTTDLAGSGTPYLFRIDDGPRVPDPASRGQLQDVHGPSLALDPITYHWRDGAWGGRPWHEVVIYELHVGTFTPQGSFQAAKERLDYLAELGVTAIQLMPVAEFPGRRNWGYDGALKFAVESAYGSPEDLMDFVQAAHALGLMVFLDVVYNHFGPEGNCLHLYAPAFFTGRYSTPWGDAINFDGGGSRWVRQFFLDNALYWLEEYHLDGLRLDAVHAIFDASQPDIVEELADTVGRKFGSSRAVHLVLEKILAGAEYLREDWAVAGTTGYDFANLVNGLFVYPPAEREMTRTYARIIGRRPEFDEVLYSCKRQIIAFQLSSELAMLVNRLDAIAQLDRRTRDYTLHGLRQALTEVVACFPVYRTYISADGVREEDRRYILWATAQAKKRIHAAADVTVLDFLCDVLLLRTLASNGEDYRARVLQFAMRFQQYTAPVMAKALEDTAFYVYHRLLALNEVGGDPRRFGVTPEAFHRANQERLRRWPQAMINTATHDSKRGEDARTRLDAISEVAGEWRLRVSRWRRSNRGKKRLVDDQRAPSSNAWPVAACTAACRKPC